MIIMNVCDFGTILKKLRKSHNMTQEEFGYRIGISKAVVSKYENGLGYPSYDTLVRIANFFGSTTDYLLGATKNRTIDVSTLNDTQIETIQRVISEFNKDNNR